MTSTQFGTSPGISEVRFATTIVGNIGAPLGTVIGVELDHDLHADSD